MKTDLQFNILRVVALVTWAIGAGASVDLTLAAGQHNKAMFRFVLFLIWVLSPFVAILAIHAFYRLGANGIRLTIYSVIVVITAASLLGYSRVLTPAGAKPAGVFLVVPLMCWILIAIAIPVAASRSRRDK